MALNFPINPTVGTTYTSNGIVYQWDGLRWIIQATPTIAISRGGTGATSAAEALNNLGGQALLVSGTNLKTVNSNSILGSGNIAVGDVTLSGTQTLTNKTITLVAGYETSVSMSANDINLAEGNYFTKTISTATTFTVSNVPASGTVGAFILRITNGGSAVVTWWSGIKWAGGLQPSLTVTGTDNLGFYTNDGGITWQGLVLSKDNR